MQRRRQDNTHLLTLNAVLNSTLAIAKYNQEAYKQFFSPDNQDLEDDDHDQQLSRYFHRTGAGFRALSFIASQPIPHGPYHQWQKCQEFFDLSLSWPDWDFRHEYR
jgi:hypothetical protein